jgi:Putative Zn-dependent protease, contains TPR repeats
MSRRTKKVRNERLLEPAKARLGVSISCIPCLLAFLIFLPSLASEFIRDDKPQIVNNAELRSWQNLPSMFTSSLNSQLAAGVHFYRPLFSTWLMLVNTISGASWVWHLSSIVLHLVCTWLVFRLFKRLLNSEFESVMASIIFAVHPIHVDAVSWISASNEVLFTVFALGAILMLLARDKSRSPGLYLFFSTALYAAALLTKETAVTALPILILIEFFNSVSVPEWQTRLRMIASGVAGYCCVTGAYFLVRHWVLPQATLETARHTWTEVFFSAPSILIFYLQKLVVPIKLSGFYVNPLISSPNSAMYWQGGAVLISLLVIGYLWLRQKLVISVAGCVIFLPLFATLAAVRVYEQGDMAHDRYLYLPSVGFALMIGAVAYRLGQSMCVRTILIATLALIGTLFAWQTLKVQEFYRNDRLFYQRGVDIDSSNALVTAFLGNTYLQEQPDHAIDLFQKAHGLAPADPTITYFLAKGLFEAHQYAAAEPLLVQVSNSPDLKPQRKPTLMALANAEMNLGHLSEAEYALRQIDRADDTYPGLHRELGTLLQREHRIIEAQAEYAREFEISGDMEALKQAASLAGFLNATKGR